MDVSELHLFVDVLESHSGRNKDKTQRTSQLSFVESWRFHRAMYRIWIMSTLYGTGSSSLGQRATVAGSETQKAFLQKFTSQELIQMSKVSRFLISIGGWVIFAECKLVGSLDVCQSTEKHRLSLPSH